jgi:tetratricopeptide (TPR) repeat protein
MIWMTQLPEKGQKPAPAAGPTAQTLLKRRDVQAALVVLALVALTLVAYAQVILHSGFLWDDDMLLTNNPLIRASDGLRRIWFTTEAIDYLPLTSTTLWVEWRLWGDHPAGYHVTNVLLHALSAVLLWRLLKELKIPGAAWVAAIFAVHPVCAASVAWISERKNTLSMVFFLLTLIAYVRFDAGRDKRWYALAILAFVAALLSKSQVLMAPVVLLGLAWWRRNKIAWRDILAVVPLLVLSGLCAAVTIWFQHAHALSRVSSTRPEGFWSRLAAAGMIPWFYLYKDLVPINLTMVYPRWNVDPAQMLSYVPGVILLAVLAVFWIYRRRWGRPLLAAMGYFVIVLFPVLGFFQMAYHRKSLVADHLQYVAILGPIVLVAGLGWYGAGKLRSKAGRVTAIVLAAAVVATLAMLTYVRGFVFLNSRTMWTDVLQKNPSCPEAYYERGLALTQEGKVQEAIPAYQAAIKLRPDYSDAHNNLGCSYLELGDFPKALDHLRRAVEARPDNISALFNLALVQSQMGDSREAAANLRRLLKVWPDYPPALSTLARILAGDADPSLRNGQEALTLALKACRLGGPEDLALANRLDVLAMAYAETGQFDRALVIARTALAKAEKTGNAKLAKEIQDCIALYKRGKPVRAEPASRPLPPASGPVPAATATAGP